MAQWSHGAAVPKSWLPGAPSTTELQNDGESGVNGEMAEWSKALPC
jgi:hypothetical protein